MSRYCVLTIASLLFANGCTKEEPTASNQPPASPVVSIASPQNNASIVDSVVIEVEASDDKGVISVEIYIDNQLDSTRVFEVRPYKWTWQVDALEDSSLHSVYAKAYDADGNVSSSQVLTVAVFRLTPSNLEATLMADTLVVLDWHDNSRVESGFEIEQSINDTAFALIDTVGPNTITSHLPGAYIVADIYRFRVRAKDGLRRSKYSNNASVVVSFPAPTNLAVLSASSDSVRLEWQDNTSFESGFDIEESTDGLSFILRDTANTDAVSAIISGPFQTTETYYFRVRARSQVNVSEPSNRVQIVYDDHLYAGGNFTTAGGKGASYVARWDGVSWSPVGSGMDNFGYVYCFEEYKGELYVGGEFTAAGGVSASRIARWNGSAWSAVRGGANNLVRALVVYNNELYAAGDFTTMDGLSANQIAVWNGSTWSSLGSGLNNGVFALEVFEGELYVGGDFTTAGGLSVNRIARWNGSSWYAVGSGVDNIVTSLAVYGNELFAGGLFTTAGGDTSRYVAKWNGSSWFSVGSAPNGIIWSFEVLDNILYAGGYFGTDGGSRDIVVGWDGANWSSIGTGNDGVYALALYNGELYAGGAFTMAGGVGANRIVKWNGLSWSVAGSGTDERIIALSKNTFWTWETLP